jgi:hypothetical protein
MGWVQLDYWGFIITEIVRLVAGKLLLELIKMMVRLIVN